MKTLDQRRRSVLAMYLCLAIAVAVFRFSGENWWTLLAFVPLLCSLALYRLAVRPFAARLTERAERQLDERELTIRNRAYYSSYRILTTALFVFMAWSLFARWILGDATLLLPNTDQGLHYLLILLAYLIVSLPASVTAWNEPDPIPDE